MASPPRFLPRLGLTGAALGLVGCSSFCLDTPTWSQNGAFWRDDAELEIPVDAAPWLLRPCDSRVAPLDCSLIVDGQRISVVDESVGGEACDLDNYSDWPQVYPTVIQTLRPSEPLTPGATVFLDCEGDDDPYSSEYYTVNAYYFSYDDDPGPPAFSVRASQIPAAPPGTLDFIAIHYTRADENQCGPQGDYLSVQIDFDAEYLREGGYVEAIYPDGQALAIFKATDDGTAWLPATRGPLTLTPVAIDGQRGESLVIDEDDMTEDLVFIPGCSVDPTPRAPGLLALTWLLAVRRRRRPS